MIELVGRAAGTMAVGANQFPTEHRDGYKVSAMEESTGRAQQQMTGGEQGSSMLINKENPSTPGISPSHHQAAIRRLYGSRGGVLQQLDNLMEAEDVHRKMDAFDPSILNQLVSLCL